MPFINDNVLDNGLVALKAAASHIWICSAEPATFTAATSTLALGSKNFGAGAGFPGAVAAGSPSGRKLTTAAVTDGAISATGTASHYGITSAAASRLDIANSLAASQAVTSGNPFTLAAFDVRLAGTGG